MLDERVSKKKRSMLIIALDQKQKATNGGGEGIKNEVLSILLISLRFFVAPT